MGVVVGALWNAASTVLAAVEDHYATEGFDLPDRRFVCDGRPAWDCDQLVVWVETVSMGTVDATLLQRLDCYHERVATVPIMLIRCTDNVLGSAGATNVPRMPAPSAIEGSAETKYRDAVLIENAIVEAERAGEFGQNGVAFLDWTGTGPDGGYSGGVLRVRVGLSHPFPIAGGS